jgi:Papain-like cysteine protease AvrRpt2
MILNFRTQKQILDNWCWAAVTSSIAFYFNGNSRWLQSTLAARLINNVCASVNANNAQTAPPVCDVQMDIGRALTLTGNLAGDILRPLSFNEVVQQINAGFPLCCQIVFPGVQTSHFVILYGYQSTDVVIGDPQAGIFSLNYQSFLTSYRNGNWRRTIGTKRGIIV